MHLFYEYSYVITSLLLSFFTAEHSIWKPFGIALHTNEYTWRCLHLVLSVIRLTWHLSDFDSTSIQLHFLCDCVLWLCWSTIHLRLRCRRWHVHEWYTEFNAFRRVRRYKRYSYNVLITPLSLLRSYLMVHFFGTFTPVRPKASC